jgi:bacterioferritin-associated ferredoxin
MIVCLCNALSTAHVDRAIADGARRPREVYAACQCRAQCGSCLRQIMALLRETPVPEGRRDAMVRKDRGRELPRIPLLF